MKWVLVLVSLAGLTAGMVQVARTQLHVERGWVPIEAEAGSRTQEDKETVARSRRPKEENAREVRGWIPAEEKDKQRARAIASWSTLEATKRPQVNAQGKPVVTRTQLQVARSLEPTELRTVRTRTGETAQLVVKKRDSSRGAKSQDVPLPAPVDIRSSGVYVKPLLAGGKRGRSLVEIDSSGVPVITGVRMPDDPEDAHKVWRNARVIDGTLVEGPWRTRTPVLQYAHPELGVQPALPSAFTEEEQRRSHQKQPVWKYQHYYKDHYKPRPVHDNRPLWQRFGESIKEQVEYGVERVEALARPVVEPLVEASHKISHNLGFGSGFSEKLGVAGSPSILLPAIGLGAALGLGAVAVGRFLDVDVLKRRSGGGARELTAEEARALRAISRGRREIGDWQSLREATPQGEGEGEGVAGAGSPLWGSTPCAKRLFCATVLASHPDQPDLMHKKMATYLAMLPKNVVAEVEPHLDEVMTAIRQGDCSKFFCHR